MKNVNIERLVDYLQGQPDIRFALLYGSTARGRANPLSDLDVAVFFQGGTASASDEDDGNHRHEEKTRSFSKISQDSPKNGLTREQMGERQIGITCDLMRLFSINNVDVTILNLASPFLCFQVLKYGKLLKCAQESEFLFFKSRAIGRYHDMKPMYDFYARKAIRDLRKRAAAPTGGASGLKDFYDFSQAIIDYIS